MDTIFGFGLMIGCRGLGFLRIMLLLLCQRDLWFRVLVVIYQMESGTLPNLVRFFLGQLCIELLAFIWEEGIVFQIGAFWGGDFSVKFAYEGQLKSVNSSLWNWRFIWNLKLPPRIQHFLWILLHGKVLTNASCLRCQGGMEDVDHLVRGCRDSIVVWEDNFKGISSSAHFLGNLEDWFSVGLRNSKFVYDNVPSYLHFAVLLCQLNETSRNIKFVTVAWVPPDEGFVKLNVDGGCVVDEGTNYAGGVVRDHSKNWLGGFVLNKGIGTGIEAELWGLFEGLNMVWRKDFHKVIVETDSMSIVQFIEKDSNPNYPMFSLIQTCKRPIATDWNCNVKHVYREANMVADGIAKMGCSMDFGVLFFEEPPPIILDIFDNDARGLFA
ncbi:hypothetical protein Ddye_006039 [Dipteronia dyeriana]|uniref:RNase H type-1 domain-containing protein n=1 Tax=Dipteronia dyeriana TaxID=168575 RepID=A0AAD9XH98_9ROSI|nr:hypothetical protein Ddye_006039 [Dipteronia dyeriana]